MDKIKVNNIVEGQITGITKYGIFVSLHDNYTGMIHISEVSNKFISNLEEKYKIGDIVKVKIISIDEDKLQVKLSLKRIGKTARTSKGIRESGYGFMPLLDNMPDWISKKMKELEKN